MSAHKGFYDAVRKTAKGQSGLVLFLLTVVVAAVFVGLALAALCAYAVVIQAFVNNGLVHATSVVHKISFSTALWLAVPICFFHSSFRVSGS